ncbi:palmitoyl-(protein) hydrolase [Aureococcus anophagefferens]|nr:palmitoyl-(protein) hydrolase [Aureococcus anophagefferens]
MQWLKEAASPRTPRGGRLREAKGMTRKRGSSFWKGAAPELHEQCSVRFDHGSLFGLQNEIADGWPERRGPAVRLASSLEASAERSYVGAIFGGGAEPAHGLAPAREGPLLVYEEPIYALSRVDLMVERVPSGGGKRIGRVDLSQVKLHADVHDGGDGDDEQTPSLTLSSARREKKRAGIYGGAAGDGAPEAPDVARVASPRGSRSRTASSAARASMSGRDDFEDGPLVEDGGFFGALWEAYDSRVDFELRNSRGLKLRCSRWLPRRDRDLDGDAEGGAPAKQGSFVADFFEDNWPLSDSERRRRDAMPTVIYCHGNASCRVEALQALPVCLSLGLSVVALDTAGSGKSEGKFVSLGFFEQSDVAAVDEHLRSACRVDRVALWGRSMGAATCLLYASRLGPETAAVVADSSFMDLRALCRDLARNIAPSVPTNLIDSAVARVASSVDYYAHFHLDDVSPAGAVKTCGAPTLLVHGAKDSFIPPAHAKALFEAFGADDVALVLDEGAHASPRGAKAVEAILQLLTLKRHRNPEFVPAEPRANAEFAAGMSDDRARAIQDGSAIFGTKK